jgi:hypothetical protein
MKLSEIRKQLPSHKRLNVDLPESSGMGYCLLEVDYDYDGASFTDHPYGSTSAREEHPAQVSIIAVRNTKDQERYDANGQDVLEIIPRGTDLSKLDWWDDEMSEIVSDAIMAKLEKDAPTGDD